MVPVGLMEEVDMSLDDQIALNACYQRKNRVRSLKRLMSQFESYLEVDSSTLVADFPIDSCDLNDGELTVTCLGHTLRSKGRVVNLSGVLAVEYMFSVTESQHVHNVAAIYVFDDGLVTTLPDREGPVIGNVNELGPLRWYVALEIAQKLPDSTVFYPSTFGVIKSL